MKDEYYKNVCAYTQAMAMAKSMLKQRIISAEDYCKIDKIIAGKYGLASCSIYRENA